MAGDSTPAVPDLSALNKVLVSPDFSSTALEASRAAEAVARPGRGEVVAHVTRAPAVLVEIGRVGDAGRTVNL